MAKKILRQSGDVTQYFGSEQGVHYRGARQNLDPVIERVKRFRAEEEAGTKARNRNGWHYAGSVPMVMITDWLAKNGYTFDQWARNDGGERGKTDPRGSGVKDQFMRYFMSRDFSKLHTNHVTSKSERSSIVVPDYIKDKK